MKSRIVFALTAILVSAPTWAAEEEEGPWSGKATLGYLATSGNTENSTLKSGFELGYAAGKWTHLATAKAINSSENEVTTAEAYELGWKSEWDLSERDFLFGRLQWRKDRFSGFDTQFSQTVGYGRHLIDTEEHNLSVEVGAGARQSELADGTTDNETILRGGLNYAWQFSDTAKFTQDFTIEAGSNNTYAESISAISASLIGELALVASYTIKHNTDVLAPLEKTDTYTALSLEYAF
jgi:putative salt-induced outer membrane protein